MRGHGFPLDLPHATALKDGDGLCSTMVPSGVSGKPERLVEIAAASPHELARLSWHIGNRHTDVRSLATSCASAATTCWKACCAGWRAAHPDRGAVRPEHGAYGHNHHDHGD